jgi:hypothetical protein
VHRLSRIVWNLLLLLTLASSGGSVLGHPSGRGEQARESDDKRDKEFQLKAAYLYNFANFVTWPESCFEDDEAPIEVAVVGEDPFGPFLEQTFDGMKVGKRGFEIERFEDVESLEDCHVLYVCSDLKDQIGEIVEFCRPRHVLVVTDWVGATGSGGIVNFFVDVKKRVRFEIQIDEAERYEIEVSSKLLKLAKVVRDEEDEEKS